MLILLSPTFRLIAPDVAPLVTAIPFTVTDAVASATVGLNVMLVVAMLTLEVYVLVADANTGDKVPALDDNPDKVALLESELTTANVGNEVTLLNVAL